MFTPFRQERSQTIGLPAESYGKHSARDSNYLSMNSLSDSPKPQDPPAWGSALSPGSWLCAHTPTVPEPVAGRVKKLQVILFITFLGYLIAGVYYYWQAVYLGRGFPYNTFLCIPKDRFTDFDNMVAMCAQLNPYHTGTHSGYPPFANYFFFLFSNLPLPIGFAIFVAVPLLYLASAVNRQLDGVPAFYRYTASLVFLVTYPVLFAIDRGNLDLWIMAALGLFLEFYDSRSRRLKDLSVVGLGAAIALKLYPAPFLLLLLKDRRYLDAFKVLVLAGLLTVFASSTFSGGAATAAGDFLRMLSTTDNEVKGRLLYASSNVGMFYAVQIVLTKLDMPAAVEVLKSTYSVLALCFLGFFLSLVTVSRMRAWASAVCIAAVVCLVPSLSNDYRLVLFLVPLLMLVNCRTPHEGPYLGILAILGLLLVPKNYLLLMPDVERGDIGIASILNPVLLIALLVLVLRAEARHLAVGRDTGLAAPRIVALLGGYLASAAALVYFLGLNTDIEARGQVLLGAWGLTRFEFLALAAALHLLSLLRMRRFLRGAGPVSAPA